MINTLKKQIKENNLSNFYIFFGPEDYIKEMYVKKIIKNVVDESFISFNFCKFDELNFDIDEFYDNVESFPVMADKKVILLKNIDIFSLKQEQKDKMCDILSDLPDYLHLIIELGEYKKDNRQKIAKIVNKTATEIEFKLLSQAEVVKFISKELNNLNLKISEENAIFLTFTCGLALNNLKNEILKLSAYCENEVLEDDILRVCIKILEAKIFDITDKIVENDINTAKALVEDLIILKTDEFSIISVINMQFQRLYTAKLGLLEYKDEKFYFDLWGVRSSYFVKKTLDVARKCELDFLRKATNLCAIASIQMISLNVDKSEILLDLILKIGAIL